MKMSSIAGSIDCVLLKAVHKKKKKMMPTSQKEKLCDEIQEQNSEMLNNLKIK